MFDLEGQMDDLIREGSLIQLLSSGARPGCELKQVSMHMREPGDHEEDAGQDASEDWGDEPGDDDGREPLAEGEGVLQGRKHGKRFVSLQGVFLA